MTARMTSPSTNEGSSKVTRLSAALGRAWSGARGVDRRLMEMRTDLSRHSG